MEVGEEKDSWIEMVGKSTGRPPAEEMPSLSEEISWGTLLWHGLKLE